MDYSERARRTGDDFLSARPARIYRRNQSRRRGESLSRSLRLTKRAERWSTPSRSKPTSSSTHSQATPSRWNGRRGRGAGKVFRRSIVLLISRCRSRWSRFIAYQQPLLLELEQQLLTCIRAKDSRRTVGQSTSSCGSTQILVAPPRRHSFHAGNAMHRLPCKCARPR